MYFAAKLRLFAALAGTAISSVALLSCVPRQSALLPCPEPSLSFNGIPDDESCQLRRLDDFGNLAWETFKTMVWPARTKDWSGASVRGEADRARKITDMDGPRVFETFKSDWETYQEGVEPLPWHRYPPSVPAPLCRNAPALPQGSLVLASLHKFGNIDISTGPPPKGITHVLVSQNHRLVRYLTAYGQQAFDTIRDNKLYQPLNIKPLDLMPEGKTKAPLGAVTVKSAWIEMNGISDPSSFYVRDAWVQHPTDGTCEFMPVGLVGLHIAHKTKASPQWIWMSFEHVKNVPSKGEPNPVGYTFHDGSNLRMTRLPPRRARLPMTEFKIPKPYNVERSKPIPQAIQAVNSHWRRMLAEESEQKQQSVWRNYELVVVQWPANPYDERRTGSGLQVGEQLSASPTPECRSEPGSNLANSVLETFIQPHTQCEKPTTCMSCHTRARNYDFMWSIPLAHKSTGFGVMSEARQSAISTLREIVESNR